MGFDADLKMALGFPQLRVELKTEVNNDGLDDFALIKARVLRIIRPYFPKDTIVRKNVPSGGAGFGEGSIDLSADNFLQVRDVYVCKNKTGTHDVALPWSTIRIWEQVWLGKSDFIGTDLLLYQNELALLNQVTNFKFGWQYDVTSQKLYVTNVPTVAIGIGIVGMASIDDLDDLDPLDIVYEYALKYGIALGKQKIGHLWRKYGVSGMDMPGSEVVQEGKEEEKDIMSIIEANAIYPGGFNT